MGIRYVDELSSTFKLKGNCGVQVCNTIQVFFFKVKHT